MINKESKREKGIKFNLIEVIVIMIITSICSITVSIAVSYSTNNTSKKIKNESDLSELIDTYNSIVNDYYDSVDNKELISAAVESMIDYLDDPYSAYLSKNESDDLNEELKGKYKGIGLEIKYSNKELEVVNVFEKTPAAYAGIVKGDKIISIDNKEVSSLSKEQVLSAIKNDKLSKISLIIERESKKIPMEIEKQEIDILSVESDIIKKNNKNIGIIRINNFALNTFEQFKNKYSDLEKNKVECLVLDLRNNKGGYLTSAESISDLFLNKDSIIYQLNKKGKTNKITSNTKQTVNMNTIVLVNNYTASAAEILTAALKENLKIDVVGENTYGKGKVQTIKKLSTGNIIKYTVENWLTPSGEEIDKKGISPTIEVKLSEKYVKNPTIENDNQLQEALDILSK